MDIGFLSDLVIGNDTCLLVFSKKYQLKSSN